MHHKMKNMKPTTEFGKWLCARMLERDLDCTMVANMLHVTKQCVANHASGRVMPNYPFVMAYCHIFGYDLEETWKMVSEESEL